MFPRSEQEQDALQTALLLFLEEGVSVVDAERLQARARRQQRIAKARAWREECAAGDLYNIEYPGSRRPTNACEAQQREAWADNYQRRKAIRAAKRALRPPSLMGEEYRESERQKRRERTKKARHALDG